MVKVILPGSKRKCELPEMLDIQHLKRRKMDHPFKMECEKILKALMTHKFGPIFNQPVDPVALRIPDYFMIITNPMDLGTVKKKLDNNMYFDAEEFASDIRLTFCNAMRYNPPNNSVHLMAKKMNDMFYRVWESLEAKLIKESKNVRQNGYIVNGRAKNTEDTSKASHSLLVKTPKSFDEKTSIKQRKIVKQHGLTVNDKAKNTLMSSEEKESLKKELLEAVRRDLPGPLRGFLRKYGLIYRKDKIESVFGSFDDDTLWELKRVVKGALCTSVGKGNEDYLKSQHKDGSESQHLGVKSNIEARIRAARAAKEALLESAKSELQMRRDRERERVEKMERTAIMDDNITILRELEKLCQCSLAYYYSQMHGKCKNPLERIGLRLKEEYIDDDGILFNDLEDGEIL